MDLKSFIRDVPNFPSPGIVFKDISPLLASPKAFDWAVSTMASALGDTGVTQIVAVESRGFLFGAPVARQLEIPLSLVRKPGKLPYERASIEYALEYGAGTLEIHRDAIASGAKVAVIDDVLATGGTAGAAGKLVTQLGGTVVLYSFLIELGFLTGRQNLDPAVPVDSIITY